MRLAAPLPRGEPVAHRSAIANRKRAARAWWWHARYSHLLLEREVDSPPRKATTCGSSIPRFHVQCAWRRGHGIAAMVSESDGRVEDGVPGRLPSEDSGSPAAESILKATNGELLSKIGLLLKGRVGFLLQLFPQLLQ